MIQRKKNSLVLKEISLEIKSIQQERNQRMVQRKKLIKIETLIQRNLFLKRFFFFKCYSFISFPFYLNQKKTCFNCRKPGHKISECPDKKSETGICFNCGSQEHILRACPQPLVDGGASYATCFICKQKGHLSSKCPKSSHGLYPNGGSCLKCGKVDHLLKDCPLKKKDQEANTVQNSDSLDDSQYIVEPVSKKKRKSNKTTNMSTAERDQPLKKMDNVQTGEKKPKEKVIMFKKK